MVDVVLLVFAQSDLRRDLFRFLLFVFPGGDSILLLLLYCYMIFGWDFLGKWIYVRQAVLRAHDVESLVLHKVVALLSLGSLFFNLVADF